MDEKIRMLLVEDDEDDYLLTRELLEETKGRFVLDWVSSYEEGLAEIGKEDHDVYLIDYRLGQRDGLDLVRMAVAIGRKAPLIVMTGAGDLQVDMDSLEAGAADYLIKGQLNAELLERSIRYSLERKRTEEHLREARDRLEAQVEERTAALTRGNRRLKREIEDRKQAELDLVEREVQLRDSEERYRIICEKSSDGIAILEKGKAVFVNPGLSLILGVSAGDLTGTRLGSLFPEVYQQRMADRMYAIDSDNPIGSFEVPYLGADGREIWTEWHLNHVEW